MLCRASTGSLRLKSPVVFKVLSGTDELKVEMTSMKFKSLKLSLTASGLRVFFSPVYTVTRNGEELPALGVFEECVSRLPIQETYSYSITCQQNPAALIALTKKGLNYGEVISGTIGGTFTLNDVLDTIAGVYTDVFESRRAVNLASEVSQSLYGDVFIQQRQKYEKSGDLSPYDDDAYAYDYIHFAEGGSLKTDLSAIEQLSYLERYGSSTNQYVGELPSGLDPTSVPSVACQFTVPYVLAADECDVELDGTAFDQGIIQTVDVDNSGVVYIAVRPSPGDIAIDVPIITKDITPTVPSSDPNASPTDREIDPAQPLINLTGVLNFVPYDMFEQARNATYQNVREIMKMMTGIDYFEQRMGKARLDIPVQADGMKHRLSSLLSRLKNAVCGGGGDVGADLNKEITTQCFGAGANWAKIFNMLQRGMSMSWIVGSVSECFLGAVSWFRDTVIRALMDYPIGPEIIDIVNDLDRQPFMRCFPPPLMGIIKLIAGILSFLTLIPPIPAIVCLIRFIRDILLTVFISVINMIMTFICGTLNDIETSNEKGMSKCNIGQLRIDSFGRDKQLNVESKTTYVGDPCDR